MRTPDGHAFEAVLLLGVQLDEHDRPTEELAARVQEAARQYHQGISPLIIACGGILPGRSRSEAEVMAEMLYELGVPAEAIQLEDQSQNTAENMRFAAEKLNGSKDRRVLVVTSDYHVRRAVMTAWRTGFRAKGCPALLAHDEAWKHLRSKEFAYTVDLLMGWQDEGRQRPQWTYRIFDAVFGRKG